jgi:hypothetical protein
MKHGSRVDDDVGKTKAQAEGRGGPEAETIIPETVPHVQQNRSMTSIHSCVTRTSTEQQTNIRPITGALDIVERLHGVFFDLKPDQNHDIGFIPEEVAQMIPEAVVYDENGRDAKAVDYNRLVAVLTEAVKEQQVQIKTLEHDLKEQKSQVARLRGEIERLKLTVRAATVR